MEIYSKKDLELFDEDKIAVAKAKLQEYMQYYERAKVLRDKFDAMTPAKFRKYMKTEQYRVLISDKVRNICKICETYLDMIDQLRLIKTYTLQETKPINPELIQILYDLGFNPQIDSYETTITDNDSFGEHTRIQKIYQMKVVV